MAFPPEFSSTKTYANRYDLDEIDVFLEGDSINPMFFSVSGIDRQFAFGKHYFNLSILDSTNQEHKFKGAMNYRCTFPIDIRKNLINADSPINNSIEHKQKTIAGAYSFVKNNVSSNSDAGTSFDDSGAPNTGVGPVTDSST